MSVKTKETPQGTQCGDGAPIVPVVSDIEMIPSRSIVFVDPTKNLDRYSPDELGLGYLYADTFRPILKYVKDAKIWRYFDSRVWKDDIGNIYVRRCMKDLIAYLKSSEFFDYSKILSKLTKRESIIRDAQDVNPISLSAFDIDQLLYNCQNGTLDLRNGQFRKHNPADLISKVANVTYNPDAKCNRWDIFVREVMCEDDNLVAYLQKSLGYSLSGDTSQECLFVLYGPTTRNGKGTLSETIYHLHGDYSMTMQPDSLAQRKANGSAPSPDIARLAGVRFVNASELPDDMRINAARVKQLTGGDTFTTRFLYSNCFEFRPQFKIFINTNHLPEIGDDSLFSSGRLKLIPFDRHFEDKEQDRGLKSLFREDISKSAILNWLLEGHMRFKSEGLVLPAKAEELLKEYRISSDVVGLYIENVLVSCADDVKARIKTTVFHADFLTWCKTEGITQKPLKQFVSELRRKNILGRDRTIGNYIKGYRLRD